VEGKQCNMPLIVNKDSFFKRGYSIRYLTSLHSEFRPINYSGTLLFYRGNPLYIVDVDVSDFNKLEEEDITITKGDQHNHSGIDDFITKNTSTIYELCKPLKGKSFALDLKEMKVVERKDFTGSMPVYGLNTFFVFENITNNEFYSLMNPAKNINDAEVYCCFLAYIYSTTICLTPRKEPADYAKKFLQALSGVSILKGNKKLVRISTHRSLLDSPLNDVGEYLFKVPGDTTRFEELTLKSLEQMKKEKHK
jgi:hypothetical protein